jgi:hypothetical protein
MNNTINKEIGDTKISHYQKVILIVGVLLLLLFTLLAFLSNNNNYSYFPIVIIVMFSIIAYLYSRIYSIEYNAEYFFVSNLFKKEKIQISQFLEIKKVKFIDFLYIIEFKEKEYFFMIKSEEIIKNFFRFKNKYAEEMTQQIKKTVAEKHTK